MQFEPSTTHEVTRLLAALQAGDPEALDRLIPLVYQELRAIAARQLSREQPDHTLQPTALVNEAYLRLVGAGSGVGTNRAHFLGVAANVMRCLLVDHARRRRARKRSGGIRVPLRDDLAGASDHSIDMLDLHEALERLADRDPRPAKVVELRYFGGLGWDEVATALAISPATAKRDWQFARAWLHREFAAPPPSGTGGE